MIPHELLRGRLRPPDDCTSPHEGQPAVLLALCPAKEAWQLLLTRRTETVAEHKGQVRSPAVR